MEYLIGAFVPALLWLTLVYVRDRYEREPKALVAKVFIACGIFPVVLGGVLENFVTGPLLGEGLFGNIVGVGAVEEVLKFLTVAALVRRSKSFNEPVDGIVYMVSGALGFSAIETTFYLLDAARPEVLAIFRGVLSAPGHLLWSGIVGYFFAANVLRGRPQWHVVGAIALVSVLHGVYNTLGLAGGPLVIVASAAIFIFLFRRALQESPFRTAELTTALKLPVTPPVATPLPVVAGEDLAVRMLVDAETPTTESGILKVLSSMPMSVAGLPRRIDPSSHAVSYGRNDHESVNLGARSLEQFASVFAPAAVATFVDAFRLFAHTADVRAAEQSFNPKARVSYVFASLSTADGPRYAALWAVPHASWAFSVVAETREFRSAVIEAFAAVAGQSGKPTPAPSPGRTAGDLLGLLQVPSGSPREASPAVPSGGGIEAGKSMTLVSKPTGEIIAQLERLNQLRRDGVLNEEEFVRVKTRLIDHRLGE